MGGGEGKGEKANEDTNKQNNDDEGDCNRIQHACPRRMCLFINARGQGANKGPKVPAGSHDGNV